MMRGMKSPAFPLSAGVLLLFFAQSTATADSRTWTDTTGRTLQGKLVRQEPAKVWVERPDGSQVPIDKSRLSPADLEFLKSQPVSAATTPPAASSAAPAGARPKPGQSVFKSARIDRAAWVTSAETFDAGGAAFTQRLETPHYLILATAKVKPDLLAAYAEAGERVFADCVNDLPSLATLLKDKRMAIFLVDSDLEHKAFGAWLANRSNLGFNWDNHTIASVPVPEETASSLKVLEAAREFRTDKNSSTAQRSLVWPNRLHFLAGDLLYNYMEEIPAGEPAADGTRRSFSTIRLGYAFYKEWQIAGRIDTAVSVGGTVVEGFQNGRRWADAVRKVLKNPAGKPSLEKLLTTRSTEAQPIDIASAFGMMQFLNADPARFKGFDSMLQGARESKATPTAEVIAKAAGFDSPAAFDTAWIAFMSSDAFR